MQKISKVMWAIKNISTDLLYIGTWLTRVEAIRDHCDALGRSWGYCQAEGDRAIKVRVTEIAKDKK